MNKDYVNQTVDKYKIVALIGEGGMGSVYLGKHILLEKKVAVKFLQAQFAQKDEMITRFFREAKAPTQIGHKNIADVIDMGVSSSGDPYMVMEYLEGESLAEMLTRIGPMGLSATCSIIEQILFGLEAAHARGIVHRDLKPANIFMVQQEKHEPTVKLIDFGISKFLTETTGADLTNTGTMLGTPAYMPPEQIRGDKSMDHRADIYSVGVIMYEMLSGRLPYSGRHYHEIISAALTDEPTPPQEACDTFPSEAIPLIMKALNKDPNRRQQSAAEMLHAFESLSSYADRQESVKDHSSLGFAETAYAGDGDDKKADARDDVSLTQAYIQMVKGSSPGQKIDVEQEPRLESEVKRRSYSRVIVVGAVLVVAAVVSFLVFFVDNNAPSDEHDIAAIETVESEIIKVNVDVKGVPSGARVYFNQELITQIPFRVAKSDLAAQLKIEAEGFEPYISSVMPSEDRVVQVQMKKADEKDDRDSDSQATSALKTVHSKASAESKSKPAKKRAGRGKPKKAPKKQDDSATKRKEKKETADRADRGPFGTRVDLEVPDQN